MSEVRVILFWPQQYTEAWNRHHELRGRLLEIETYAHADVPYDPDVEKYLLGRAAVIATEMGIDLNVENGDGRSET